MPVGALRDVPGPHRRGEHGPAPRARPSRRVFLVRRVVALAGLGAIVSLVVSLAWGGGGDTVVPATRGAQTPAGGQASAPGSRSTGWLASRVSSSGGVAVGARGKPVRAIQQALGVLGFSSGAPDGVLGETTGNAVAAFQRASGLSVDGAVTAGTVRALDAGLVAWGRQRTAVARYLRILAATTGDLVELSPGRSAVLAVVLGSVQSHAPVYDRPRARTLFTMLEVNARRLRGGPPGAPGGNTRGPDGVTYRFARDRGFQFHPLAKLRAAQRPGGDRPARRGEAPGRRTAGARDADRRRPGVGVLLPVRRPVALDVGARVVGGRAGARAGGETASRPGIEPSGEVGVRRDPGPARATSGRRHVGARVQLQRHRRAQRAAAVARVDLRVRTADGDTRATAFTRKLDIASRALLPGLDTGCWSRYSVGGASASAHYHAYNVTLLRQLAAAFPAQPLWARAERWKRYAARGGCAG